MAVNPFTSRRDLDNVDTRDPPVKPIEEVQVVLAGLVKDVSSIRSDIAVIKNRLYEIMRDREQMKKHEQENINKGWGWGFY